MCNASSHIIILCLLLPFQVKFPAEDGYLQPNMQVHFVNTVYSK
jgi:hypothetical protein